MHACAIELEKDVTVVHERCLLRSPFSPCRKFFKHFLRCAPGAESFLRCGGRGRSTLQASIRIQNHPCCREETTNLITMAMRKAAMKAKKAAKKGMKKAMKAMRKKK